MKNLSALTARVSAAVKGAASGIGLVAACWFAGFGMNVCLTYLGLDAPGRAAARYTADR